MTCLSRSFSPLSPPPASPLACFSIRRIMAPAQWLVAVFASASFLAAARGRPAIARWFVVLGFCPACALIGRYGAAAGDASAAAGSCSRIASADSRSRRSDLERHETPVQIEGRLLADAYATDAGAALRVRVERALGRMPAPSRRTAACRSLSLARLPAMRSREWRAGRTIRATAVLRRPARYLERGRARSGAAAGAARHRARRHGEERGARAGRGARHRGSMRRPRRIRMARSARDRAARRPRMIRNRRRSPSPS